MTDLRTSEKSQVPNTILADQNKNESLGYSVTKQF